MEKRFCVNHPLRPAAGECVVTKKPICQECSTRYEGVNYSKEGLEELKRRRMERAGGGSGRKVLSALFAVQAPVSFLLMYLFYLAAFRAVLNLLN